MRNLKTALAALALLGAAAPAFAVDGVVLIDQNKAVAGNVTPGDAAGFPVVIGAPGSYRLSSNLTLTSTTVDAIQITADDVTLDLNGFVVKGAATCTGTNCTPAIDFSGATGSNGIRITGKRAAVSNGAVRGFAQRCVTSQMGGRMERLQVSNCGLAGISFANGGQLLFSNVSDVVGQTIDVTEAVVMGNYFSSTGPVSGLAVNFSTFTNNAVKGPAFFATSDGLGMNMFVNPINRGGAVQYTQNVCAQAVCP